VALDARLRSDDPLAVDDLGEVLVLMHGARNRFHSVRLEARERSLAVSRVWWVKPDRLREEVESLHDGDHTTVRVVNGARWTFLAGGELHSSEHVPGSTSPPSPRLAHVLDPAPLLPIVDLEVVGRATHAGREGIRVVARPREVDDPLMGNSRLPPGADEHELVVDAHVGVLLRMASRIGGEDFAVTEVTDIAFDEEIPDERFVLVPPPGVHLAEPPPPLPGPATREVTLADAARTAPFTVLAPARLPEGWELGSVSANVAHPAVVPQVTLTYRLGGGWRGLTVIEAAAGSTPLGDVEEEVVEHDGRYLRLIGEPAARVRLERDGTDVRLSGDLPLEDLLGVAASFRPVPRNPTA
jgi:hypothetical protein